MEGKVIAIDFDGTITEDSEYPVMGKIKEKAVEVIKELKKKNTIILWTCRTGEFLQEAVNALKEKGLEFDYINEYPGCGSKVFANIYIDDRAFHSCVDWDVIKEELL